MSATTQQFLLPLVSLCLFATVLSGSIYSITRLVGLRSADHSKWLVAEAIVGFVPPMIILFAWELIFSEVLSFNIVSLPWLLLSIASIILLVAKSPKFGKVRSYAAGLMLGCCAFPIFAIYMTMLD